MNNPNPVPAPDTGFVMSPTLYNRLKFLVQVVLPAFGSLYFGLGAIWGLPAADKVVGTCALLATFIGALVFVSARTYANSDARFDGAVVVTTDPNSGKQLVSFEIPGDPHEVLEQKSELLLKIT